MSKSLWKRGAAKASRFAFENQVKANKADPQALKQAGISAYKSGDLKMARTRLDESVAAGGDDDNLWKTRGVVYEESRNSILFDDDFKTILEFTTKGYESYEQALRHVKNVMNPGTLVEAGLACQNRGEWERAIACYSNVVINFPQYRQTNQVTFLAACVMAQSGQFEKAVQYMEMVLQSPPEGYKEADIIIILARLYEISGRKREANDSYREIHRLYKNNVMNKKVESHGSFQTWKSWHKNATTWMLIAKRFADLRCPIFAADATMEALKRGYESKYQGSGEGENAWILLARMRIWIFDKNAALQSLVSGINQYPYHMKTRQLIEKMDADTWTPVFRNQATEITKIQKVFRGTRGRVKAYLKKTEAQRLAKGATSLQKIFRGKKGRRLFIETRNKTIAVQKIQRAYRGHNSKNIVRLKRRRRNSARKIQRLARSFLWRKHHAIKIQRIARGMLARGYVRLLRLKIKSSVIIQSVWRSYRMRQMAKHLKALKDGAIGLQRMFRGQRDRRVALLKKRRFVGAREFQKIYRAFVAKVIVRKMKGRYATLLQKQFRGHRDRLRIKRMKNTVKSKETPVVRLMRMAAMEPGCTWLAARSLADKQYLRDCFEGDVIVSETNSLGVEEAKLIAAFLFKNQTLRKLIIAQGTIGDMGMKMLATSLQFNSCLETLAIGPNGISNESIVELARVMLDHNIFLQNLVVEKNILSEASAMALGSAIGDFFIRNYGKLQSLTLCYAGLTNKSASVFGKALFMNRSLQRMDLSGNHIGNAATVVIAESLKSNSVLLELCLDDNHISYGGIEALAEALDENDSLRILQLQHNLIQDDAGKMLLCTFQRKHSLRSVRVIGNPLGPFLSDQFEAIGIFRATDDTKIILANTVLPPLHVTPSKQTPSDSRGSKSELRSILKTRSHEKKTSPLSSPLVLSPYLQPPEQVVKGTLRRQTIALPSEWDYRKGMMGDLTRPSESILGTKKYPITMGPQRARRIKPIHGPYNVLCRPPTMKIDPISERDLQKISLYQRHIFSRKSTAELDVMAAPTGSLSLALHPPDYSDPPEGWESPSFPGTQTNAQHDESFEPLTDGNKYEDSSYLHEQQFYH